MGIKEKGKDMLWIIGISVGAGVLVCVGAGLCALHIVERTLHPHDWE